MARHHTVSLHRATAIARTAIADAADVVVVVDGAGTIVVNATAARVMSRHPLSATRCVSHRTQRHATSPAVSRRQLRLKRWSAIRHPPPAIRPTTSALVASA